jgi:hypothetical protein
MPFTENSQSNIKKDLPPLFEIFEEEIYKYDILLFYIKISGGRQTEFSAYEDKK